MDDELKSDDLAIAVVEAVAELEGTDITDLPTLADSVNPAALDNVFSPRLDGTSRSGHVQFSYAGYTVRVHSDETIELDD